MTRKKLLVEDARTGLNALRNQLMQEFQSNSSYRERFRRLARERAITSPDGHRASNPKDSKSGPNPQSPDLVNRQ